MSDLLVFVLDAHGGLLWTMRGQEGILAAADVTVDVQEQRRCSRARPGVAVAELEPDGDRRRLRVAFPATIATHSGEQVFHYDDAGLLRRHDYAPARTARA